MGQSNSRDSSDTTAGPDDVGAGKRIGIFKQIETLDEFLDRFRNTLGGMCLSRKEKSWLDAIFTKFETGHSGDAQTYWTESDLTNFLSITFPPETKPFFESAAPLLHRWFRALGNFPYHQTPAEHLTLDILRIAIVFLTRRHDRAVRLLESDVEAMVDIKEYFKRDEMVIVFQSLAAHEAGITLSTVSDERQEADDEHLVQVHGFVSRRNVWRDPTNPKVGQRGAPIPDPSQFPSSFSKDLSARIPVDEFRGLVGILVSSQFYEVGLGPETINAASPEFGEVVNSVLNSFSSEKEKYITWDRFSHTISNTGPNFFTPLPRLIAPFLSLAQYNPDISTSTPEEAIATIRRGFTTPNSEPPFPGDILKPPLHHQLATFIPPSIPLHKASIKYTADPRIPPTGIAKIRSHTQETDKDWILFISGTTRLKQEVGFGIFLPRIKPYSPEEDDNEHWQLTPCLFQYKPIQRVWWSEKNARFPIARQKGTKFEVELRTREQGKVSLTVDDEARVCDFVLWRDEEVLEFEKGVEELFCFLLAEGGGEGRRNPFWIDPFGYLNREGE